MRWFGAAVLAALALALPAHAAAPITDAQLAIMPLPTSALGAAAAGLPLAVDSGPVSNARAASYANGKVTTKTVAALGRLGGYSLDYGSELSGAAGVSRVATEVDLYRDRASAVRALAFWKTDERNVSAMRKLGIAVTVKQAALPAVGDDRFAFSARLVVGGLKPIYGVDAYFRVGRLVAEISVAAAPGLAERTVASLARQTERRIALVLAGKLHEQPVALPKAKAGPPPNGPDLAKLAVQPADLGSGKVVKHGYVVDKSLSPVSEYHATLSPAGAFVSLTEQVMLFHGAPEAAYTVAALHAFLSQPGAVTAPTFKSVHIDAVPVAGGDEAHGQIVTLHLKTGQTVYEAISLVRVGAVVELLTAVTVAKIAPAALKSLTRVAAKRIAGKLSGPPTS